MKRPRYSLARHLAGIVSGPLVAAVVLCCPAPETLGPQGLKGLALVLWIIAWWVTGAFALPLTSLLGIPLCILMGILPLPKAISFLGSPTMLIMIGSMFLLGAMKESRLIERYTYSMVTSSWVNHSPSKLLVIYGFSVGILSAIMPNIPVAILFTTIAVELGKSMNAQPGDMLTRALVVCSGAGANLGGGGTPVGGVPNLLVMGLVASAVHEDIQFWQWSAMGLPLALAWLAAMIVVCWFLYIRRCSQDGSCISLDVVHDRLKALGPMSRKEKISLFVLVVALFCWSFGQPVCSFLGLKTLASLLNTPFIAIVAGVSLFLIPVGAGEKVSFAMDWKSGVRAVNWDIIIFIAGALMLGQVMIDSHIDTWLGELLGGLLTGLSPELVWLTLIVVCAVMAQIINPVAVISLLVPMSASFAAQNGLPPVTVSVTVGMSANLAVMFPFSSPPMAAALLGSEGYVTSGDFFKVSIPLLIICMMLAWLVGMTLGPLVFR
ncbi:SLC13 family permease [uncultured Mailhella sp.]|uniref:SLC13 family permease n=1 Tax=uncultured Mailhella sp. TaxID=1981031 RepID=UPI0025D17586|nr:SLC13 family permease [uncultured Mailhella sp.]